MLHFLKKNAGGRQTPQRSAELEYTTGLIQQLTSILGLHNKRTPSEPQMISQDTQTPAPGKFMPEKNPERTKEEIEKDTKAGGGTSEAGTQTTQAGQTTTGTQTANEVQTQTEPETTTQGTQANIPAPPPPETEEVEMKKANLLFYITESRPEMTEEELRTEEARIMALTEDQVDDEIEEIETRIGGPIAVAPRRNPPRIRQGRR